MFWMLLMFYYLFIIDTQMFLFILDTTNDHSYSIESFSMGQGEINGEIL